MYKKGNRKVSFFYRLIFPAFYFIHPQGNNHSNEQREANKGKRAPLGDFDVILKGHFQADKKQYGDEAVFEVVELGEHVRKEKVH